jgi:uncharacterized protein involved in type VI secretion and phage assembly
MKEDSMDRWRSELRLQTNGIDMRSWDYRTLNTRQVSASGTQGDSATLVSSDVPGAYAYASISQGQRLADNQLKALEARREVFIGAGTVRTLRPGTTFALAGQAVFDLADNDDVRGFTITRAVHLMHNNLSADLASDVVKRVGKALLSQLIDDEQKSSLHAVGTAAGDRPLYRNRIDAMRANVPFRASLTDSHGQLLHSRPTVKGQQSAVVVGLAGATIHTDRDHRVKVQFHWQRGTQSHSRLSHPDADSHTGAPGDDTAGTWVRVAAPLAPIAGANWGSHALPRVGQEVLVDFLEGNIDRPVIIGGLYNGKGAKDAQSNQVTQGAGAAIGNAPVWFPGDAAAHAHGAVLSGLKSQAMSGSQDGSGAYSQLVFDDSAGQSRVALQRHASAHKGTAELNMGHLRHQTDNQRLPAAGFGAELKTEHSVALRASKGMLVSANVRIAANSTQMDTREAQTQIEGSAQLQKSLATTAQKHNVKLKDEEGKDEAAAEKLAALEHMTKTAELTKAEDAGGGRTSGGNGNATAYGAPLLQLSAPSGIAVETPVSALIAASGSISFTAAHDINIASQGNLYNAVSAGISMFTYGKATGADKPNKEVGIALNAASGTVRSQSQGGETRITADKTITMASITKKIGVSAKDHVLMTAQGATLKLEGGNIMLHGPGRIEFKAGTKELKGPKSVTSATPPLPAGELKGCALKLASASESGAVSVPR